MKKTLNNQDVYTLPTEGSLDLTVKANAEVWVEDKVGARETRTIKVDLEAGARLHWMSAFSLNDSKIFHVGEGARLEYFHHAFGECKDEVKVLL